MIVSEKGEEDMKKTYTKPRAYKLDYTYEEQVTAFSAIPSYSGYIGSIHEGYGYCQFDVDENWFTTCQHYFTTADLNVKCITDQRPKRSIL